MAAFQERAEGQSNVGSTRTRSALAVNTAAGTASGLILVDSAGVEYVLWVDTTGDLQIGTRAQWIALTGSAVVGSQS